MLTIGAAAPAQAAAEIDDGILRYDAFVSDSVTWVTQSFTAQCPPSHPYLKRFHTGTYDPNGDGARPVPGGVIVYEAGPVHVSAVAVGRTEHHGPGPSGVRTYEAFGAISGQYYGWGGTDVQIVLWCVSDPFNGAVAEIR